MNTWRKKMHPETLAVRTWMLTNNVLVMDIVRAVGCHNSAVSHFLAGRIASAKLRRHFIAIGCPERLMKGLDRLRRNLQREHAAEKLRETKKERRLA